VELQSEYYKLKAATTEASEDYEDLQMTNSSLLSEHNDARWRCEDLENDLKKANADSATRIAALEATVKTIKTRRAEVAAADNKRLTDLEAELSRDLTELRELYVCNIRSIGDLCSPMPKGDSLATDYIRWLLVEVGDLPKVFAGVNENFISSTVEGALMMAGDSVDLNAIQDVAVASGANILPTAREVQRAARAVAKNWWRSFGYEYVLDAIHSRLHEVISSILLCLFLLDSYNCFFALSGVERKRRSDG
jgi:hypothetical protein